MVIPFLGTAGWYAAWLRHILDGASDTEAAAEASRRLDPRRDFRRTLIGEAGNHTMISVPLAKGPGLRLSDHGNWPHVHLGTINALYGRSPYFPHLFPELTEVYSQRPDTLPLFAEQLHGLVLEWMDMEAVRMIALSEGRCHAAERGKEIATYINCNISILDALFRLGRTTGLALAASLR